MKSVRVHGGKSRSLARALWRNLESLPSQEQMERVIAREVSRSERNGQHFSLALFRVRRGGRAKSRNGPATGERRLALSLLRRCRLTDEVGWFNEEHLCVVLPDTSAAGARVFADSVCDLVARKGPRPISVVYSYPFSWTDDDHLEGGRTGTPDDRRKNLDDDNDGEGPTSTGRARESYRGESIVDRLGIRNLGAIDGEPTNESQNRLGLGSSDLPSADGRRTPANGRGSFAASEEGGVAVAVAPARTAVASPAPSAVVAQAAQHAGPEMKPLNDLLAHHTPWWKRTLDVVGAATLITAFSPVLAVAAVAIRLTSPGPAVFKQRRAGLGGRPFTIYKFRTMCADAEAKKKALRKLSEQDGPAFKLARDPRITAVGAFLRKTSIDELPQLFNVLKGDMSLVGPRPLPIDEQGAAEPWQQRRLDVTPGLTCIWQIEGRSRVTFAEWVRMDVSYMRRRTILHDLSILFKTIPAVLLRRGAR